MSKYILLSCFLITITARAQDFYDTDRFRTIVYTACKICSTNKIVQDSIPEYFPEDVATENRLFHNSHVYFFKKEHVKAQNTLIDLTASKTADPSLLLVSDCMLAEIYKGSGLSSKTLNTYKKIVNSITKDTDPYLTGSIYILMGNAYYKKKVSIRL